MTDQRRGDERVGDPAVDAAWRRASADEPPSRVDDAILAAAREAARAMAPTRIAPRQPSWWVRWQPLAAAAGVVGLGFVLVQLMPREETVHAPPVARAPQRPPPDAIHAPAESPGRTEAQATAEVPAAAKVQAPAPAAVPAVSTLRGEAPAPAAAEQSADSRESSVADAAQTATASRAAVAGAAPQRAGQLVAIPKSPEAWARRVAELHAQGEVAAAATELRAFRRVVADADEYLPTALRPWAASVTDTDRPASTLPER